MDKIDRLISLTKEKNALLDNMLDIMTDQKDEIEEENLDAIKIGLNKKDDIIKKIDELDRHFFEEFEALKVEHSISDLNELDTKDFPNLRELKDQVKEVSSTLLALSFLDKENGESLKIRLEKAKVDLSKVKMGQKAYKGYKYNFSDSMLIDKRK